jgi:hypothetical protein
LIVGYVEDKGTGIGGGAHILHRPNPPSIALSTNAFMVKGTRGEVRRWLDAHANLKITSTTDEIYVETGNLNETNAGKILMQAYATNFASGGDIVGPLVNAVGGSVADQVGGLLENVIFTNNYAVIFSQKKGQVPGIKTRYDIGGSSITVGQIVSKVGSLAAQFSRSKTPVGPPPAVPLANQFENSSVSLGIDAQFERSKRPIGWQ